LYLPGSQIILSRVVEAPAEEALQPAGVDLSVGEIEELVEPGFLGVESRRLPKGRRLEPSGGRYRLEPGAYRVRFREIVSIPIWSVGFCYPRSSLLRMGATLNCAVWDPGYRGRGAALLVVYNGNGITIEKGARIAQLVLARLEALPRSSYEGAYQGEGIT